MPSLILRRGAAHANALRCILLCALYQRKARADMIKSDNRHLLCVPGQV
jgi:hypothetical protein